MSTDLFQLFYEETTVSNGAFTGAPTFAIDFRATGTITRIDGAGDVLFSLDGRKVHGRLKASDNFIALDFCTFSKIWFRMAGAVPADIRFWAWENQ